MWHVALESVTVNSPSGSTLQCGRWLWDDMPLNLPKRPPYWNSMSGFNFDHIAAVSMSFYMLIFKMAISAILDFRDPIMGSLKKPKYNFL